jgi:hypothetical protein
MAYAERLQVKFERAPSGFSEDVDVVTLHFRQLTGVGLDSVIREDVEDAFGTFWASWKTKCHSWLSLSEYRWYDQLVWPTPSPVIRVTDVTNVPGTSTATSAMPPQVATTVTLETQYRKRWGRFFLPCTTNIATDNTGRMDTGVVDSLATAAKTFLDACVTAGAQPVVWSPRGGVGPPAFAAGDLLDVTGIRVDSIMDTMRKRRWQSLPYRKILALA